MPVGFARSIFIGKVAPVPKQTRIRINGVNSESTGLFLSTGFSLELDEMGIVPGNTVGNANGRAYQVNNGTYNMQITGGGTSISTSLVGSGISSSVTVGKGKFGNVNDPSTWSFNVSKNYSGTRSGTTGSVPIDNVNLPYDFGTVTFSNDYLTMRAGLTTGSGNTQGTPNFFITLYEIVS